MAALYKYNNWLSKHSSRKWNNEIIILKSSYNIKKNGKLVIWCYREVQKNIDK